jgi:hypothetical protein
VGSDSGTGTGAVNFNAALNPGSARSGHITVTSGNASGQLTVNQDSGVLSASFTVTSTTGLPVNNCRVDPTGDTTNPAKLKCTFDASSSTPGALISTYEFVLTNTGKSLGKGIKLMEPVTSCGFPYNTEVTIQLNITSSDGRNANTPVKIVLTKPSNGPC